MSELTRQVHHKPQARAGGLHDPGLQRLLPQRQAEPSQTGSPQVRGLRQEHFCHGARGLDSEQSWACRLWSGGQCTPATSDCKSYQRLATRRTAPSPTLSRPRRFDPPTFAGESPRMMQHDCGREGPGWPALALVSQVRDRLVVRDSWSWQGSTTIHRNAIHNRPSPFSPVKLHVPNAGYAQALPRTRAPEIHRAPSPRQGPDTFLAPLSRPYLNGALVLTPGDGRHFHR